MPPWAEKPPTGCLLRGGQSIEMILAFENTVLFVKMPKLYLLSQNSTFPWTYVKTRRSRFRTSAVEFTKHGKMPGGCRSHAFFSPARMDPPGLADACCAHLLSADVSPGDLRGGGSRRDRTDTTACNIPARSYLLPNLIYGCLHPNSL